MVYLNCNNNRGKRVKDMKKMNAKGFTLIELLAVITIMGILMIVAIPAVTRTIENSRKDTFVNTVQNYVGGLKTMWAADNLSCNDVNTPGESYVSSAVSAGWYYVEVDSKNQNVPQLLESGGKSPWGSRDIRGYIIVHVQDATNAAGVDTRKIDYYPVLVDDIHGVNIKTDGTVIFPSASDVKKSEALKRGDLAMSGAKYTSVGSITGGNATINTPSWTSVSTTITASKCTEV